MDMSKLSDADVEALASGNMAEMSDEGLEYVTAIESGQNPEADQGAFGKFGNPQRWQAVATGSGPYSYNAQHPDAPMFAPSPPAILPGVNAPGILLKAATALSSSAPRRIGASGVVGGVEGAIHTPQKGETRLGNTAKGAVKGAAIAAGAEGLAGFLQATGIGSKWFGRKTGGLDPEEATAYMKNPQEAEAMANMNRTNPDTLSKRMRAKLSKSLEDLFKNVSEPELAKITEGGVGKSVRVNPADFEGTAAADEIQRAHSTQGKTTDVDVPVYEVNRPQMTPVEPKISYGKSTDPSFKQDAPWTNDQSFYPPKLDNVNPGTFANESKFNNMQDMGKELTQRVERRIPADLERANAGGINPYAEPMTAEVSTVERSINKAGPVQTLDEVLTPAGSQKVGVPAPMPETLELTHPQALRAKRDAQNASDHVPGINPTVADTELSKKNAAAAASLGKGLVNSADANIAGMPPGVREAYEAKHGVGRAMEATSENAALASKANELFSSNPSRILQSSDTIGSTPVRAVQKALDTKTGSNFVEAADAFGAGNKLTAPHAGNLGRAITQQLARGTLRGASKLQSAASKLKTPGLPAAILDQIQRNSTEK